MALPQNNWKNKRKGALDEFNNEYYQILAEKGLKATGIFSERNLVEIVEIPEHPWFVAVQFHPEFKSRPGSPHPLFRDFIKASMK